MHFIEFDNVCKFYHMGENRIAAADHISFFVEQGEFCVIVGPSGGPVQERNRMIPPSI